MKSLHRLVLTITHLVAIAALALVPVFATVHVQAQAVSLTLSAAKSAGTDSSGSQLFNQDFGPATTVALNTPNYVAFDKAGVMFFSDTASNCVRKIDSAGNVSTVVGLTVTGQGDTCNTASNATPDPTQGLLSPTGIALAPNGDLYIADSGHNCVRLLPDTQLGTANLVTVAGVCASTPALSQTPSPSGLALDAASNLYISVSNTVLPAQQVLRHAAGDPAINLCIMAGAPSVLVPLTCTGVTNGITLNTPNGLVINAANDLYIADTGNQCVRKIAGMTTQQTVVGQCTNDSTGSATTALIAPYGIALSQTQVLIITDSNRLRSFSPLTGALTEAGGLPSNASGGYDTTQDGAGAQTIPFNAPLGISVDASNNFILADSANHILRKLSPNNVFSSTPVSATSSAQGVTFNVNQNSNLSVAAGTDYSIVSNTCTGPLSAATAGNPPTTCQVFVSFNPTRPGARYAPLTVLDSVSGTRVTVGLQGTATGAGLQFFPGVVNTVASSLANPVSIATDIDGNAYFVEQGTGAATADVREIVASSNTLQTIVAAGTGLDTPSGVIRDAAGNFYVTDQVAGRVSRFGADGSTNLNYLTGLATPVAIAVDGFGNLYVSQGGAVHNLIKIYASGTQLVIAGSGSDPAANGVPAANALFVNPTDVHVDRNGVVYVADGGGHRVYAIDRSGVIYAIAGNGTTTTTTAGSALGTGLVNPSSIAIDAAGDVYIADRDANRVYVVFAASSATTTLATLIGDGNATSTGDGGPANTATINSPRSVAVDGSGNVFIVEGGNNAIRKITYPAPTINFGTVLLNQTSPAKSATFWNTGTDALSQTGAGSFTGDTAEFDVLSSSSTCGASITSGGTCDLGFIFEPTTAGAKTATLTAPSNAYNTPGIITLTGNAASGLPLVIAAGGAPAETEVYRQPFLQIVTATFSGTAPTGTVTFSVNGVTTCTLNGTLGATNTCNAPATTLPVGTYTVLISYSGDANYSPATGTVPLTVTPAPITVVVDSKTRTYGTPNPALTGTITGVVPGETVNVAYATTATITSPVGSYPITATLTAGAGTSLSNYAVTNTPGTLTVTAVPTVTTIATSGTPVPVTTSVTFTATVSSTLGAVTIGNVTFRDGSTVLGTSAVNASGQATYTTTSLTAGSHAISATYGASAGFTGSTASLTQVMTVSPGSFTITASPSTQIIRGAGSTTWQVTVTSTGGFFGPVALSCAGLPADAGCTFAQGTVNLTAGSTATTTMTTTTTLNDALAKVEAPSTGSYLARGITAASVLPFELSGIGVLLGGFRRRKPLTNRQLKLTLLVACSFIILGLAGCGCPPTANRTYTITVTGTSTLGGPSPQSTQVFLTVGAP